MKRFLIVGILFMCLSAVAQDKITITIAGVQPEVEQQFLNHDVIMEWRGYNNITVRAKNKGKNGWALSSSKIYAVDFDPYSKHYKMAIACDIKASEWLDINKPMIIRFVAHTSFGNKIWWEQECTRSMDGASVLLDHYSRVEGKTDQPTKGIYVHTKQPTAEVNTKLSEVPGDKPAGKDNIIFQARNEGQEEWPIQITTSRYFSGRFFNFAFETGDKIDFSKKVEYRFAAQTVFGNYYWITASNSADKIYLPIEIDHFTGKAFDAEAPLRKSASEAVAESKETPAKTVEKKAPVKEKVVDPYTTFTVHVGKLKIANKPDSVVLGNIKSKLEEDGSIKIGSATNAQEIKLKGGSPINYNPGKGYVIEATANGDQTYTAKNGEIVIKGDAPVQFSKFYIKAAILSEDATLRIEDNEIPVKAVGKPGRFDVLFDDSGVLKEACLSKDMQYEIGGKQFDLKAGSKVVMMRGKFSQVALVNDMPLLLSDKTFNVRGDNGVTSSVFFDYKTGAVNKLVLTGDNQVDIEGKAVPVKSGSWMTFEVKNGTYTIDQFHVGEEITVNLYKKNKVKTKTVKKGKRVTIENGKVTKIALF